MSSDDDKTTTSLLPPSARDRNQEMTKAEKPKWKSKQGGLHRLYVDGDVVAMVEQGSETRRWWWAAWIHNEPAYGNAGTLKKAKKQVKEWLAGA